MALTLSDFKAKFPSHRTFDRYIAIPCPLPGHADDNPSCLVWDDGYYNCLGCHARGTHEQLMRIANGMPATTVIYEKPRWNGPNLPRDKEELALQVSRAHNRLVDNPSYGWYWKMRGIEDRIIPSYLGYEEGWYYIPIFDRQRNYRGVILRASAAMERATGERYFIPPGQQAMMYVPDWALARKSEVLAITFGMIDALALADLRTAAVTTSGSGKSTFSSAWLDQLPRKKRYYILPDRGEEEEANLLAREIGLRAEVVRLPYPEGMKDPADMLKSNVPQPQNRQQLERWLHSRIR